MFSDGAKQGGVCYEHGPDPPKKSAPKTPFLNVSEQPLSVCHFSQNIFVESTHDARLEGGFQRKISENNDKTNVYCLIGAAGDFF